jgi:hypothetical protein
MVVEDIITSLKNAVEHGDSLENAMQLAINSGYNARDVQEAAQYVSGSSANYLQPKPSEQLSMPAQKSFVTGNIVKTSPQPQVKIQAQQPSPQVQPQQFQQPLKQPLQSISITNQPKSQPTQPINNQISGIRQDSNAIKENISSGYVYQSQPNTSIYNEIKQIKPAKESYIKEIILIIILIMLVLVLISSFIFKDQIINFLNSL